MLQQVFYMFVMIIVLMLAVTLVEIGLPGWRFIKGAEEIIGLYEAFQKKIKEERPEGEKIKISYEFCKMEFDNEYEASLEFERMIDIALAYYDELDWIQEHDEDGYFKTKKDKLEEISYEIRINRWKGTK